MIASLPVFVLTTEGHVCFLEEARSGAVALLADFFRENWRLRGPQRPFSLFHAIPLRFDLGRLKSIRGRAIAPDVYENLCKPVFRYVVLKDVCPIGHHEIEFVIAWLRRFTGEVVS
jgi:hypothetical protein